MTKEEQKNPDTEEGEVVDQEDISVERIDIDEFLDDLEKNSTDEVFPSIKELLTNIDLPSRDQETDKPSLSRKLDLLLIQLETPSISEAIRFIESDKFALVTEEDFTEIGNYHTVNIDGELFFDKAFSRGKEIVKFLRAAKEGQVELVLKKLKSIQVFF